MVVSKFTLTVASTSSNIEHLMVILNPKLIAQNGTNYENYFPVVWKILQFTANNPSLPHNVPHNVGGLPHIPRPITIEYDSGISTVLQQINSDNIVYSADYLPVTFEGEEFLINNVKGSDQYALQATKKIIPGCSTAILNTNNKTFNVGLGDKVGNSYLTMELQSQNTLAFTYDAEFAIVPVGLTVQDSSKVVSGSVLRPWFSFRLSDLQTEDPSFTFDGTTIVNPSGFTKISNHPSDEIVFGGSS
ncbi:hypothetical protein EDD21DRAFT_405532 [Dissophora ornata]|nr:hypothetical protein BGZ58_007211 [Dissophora ornata]KAI8600060.1 hypothetical protein EDD21DRAFT_405532 [Dissophora ornata]